MVGMVSSSPSPPHGGQCMRMSACLVGVSRKNACVSRYLCSFTVGFPNGHALNVRRTAMQHHICFVWFSCVCGYNDFKALVGSGYWICTRATRREMLFRIES